MGSWGGLLRVVAPAMLSGRFTLQRTQPVRFVVCNKAAGRLRLVSTLAVKSSSLMLEAALQTLPHSLQTLRFVSSIRKSIAAAGVGIELPLLPVAMAALHLLLAGRDADAHQGLRALTSIHRLL